MREVDVHQAGRLLYGGVVTLLSARLERQSNLMAASWIVPLSTRPPLLGVSLTPSCWTHKLVRETGEFVLNIPNPAMLRIVHACGTYSGRDIDKPRLLDISLTTSRMVKPLRVVGSVGFIECEVRDWHKVGDRSLVVAEIIYAAADENEFAGRWGPDSKILRHLGGNRYQCGAEVYELKRVSLPGATGTVITGEGDC